MSQRNNKIVVDGIIYYWGKLAYYKGTSFHFQWENLTLRDNYDFDNVVSDINYDLDENIIRYVIRNKDILYRHEVVGAIRLDMSDIQLAKRIKKLERILK